MVMIIALSTPVSLSNTISTYRLPKNHRLKSVQRETSSFSNILSHERNEHKPYLAVSFRDVPFGSQDFLVPENRPSLSELKST